MKINKKIIVEIVIVLLIFSLALLFYLSSSKEKAGYIEIICDNEKKCEYSLNIDRTLTIVKDGETYTILDGEQTDKQNYNIVVVENGTVYVKEADCPADGPTKCANQGKKQYRGESIICLEHNIVIKVFGEEGDADSSSK